MNGKSHKYMIYIAAAYIIAALLYIHVHADSGFVFRIDMDSLNLQKGISGNIIISLRNAQGAEIIGIDGIENFDILSQSQSSVTNIIGSAAEYENSYHYTVMPKNAGQFNLKAYILFEGQIYETNALEIKIADSSAENGGEALQDVFILTVLSHKQAYSGEKIVLTYELYSRYSIDGYGFLADFSMDGIVVREIPENQLKSEYVYLDGERYAKYEVKRLIIDPIKTGSYIIPSFSFQVNVITNSSFGFFRSTNPVYLQTKEQEFILKPLPSDGRPDDFSGIVGELQIASRYSRDELNYGDSLILYVNLSGNCNLDVLKNDIVGEIPGFSVYETSKNTVESFENNKYHIQKDFEAILVPEKNGVLEISPIFISYFNSVTEKYEKAEIPGAAVTVLGDMPQPINSNQIPANETLIINQVKYTETKNDYFTFQIKKETALFISAGLVLLVIFSIGLIRYISKNKKQNPALKSMYKKLKTAKDTNEIYLLFNSMIKSCYNFSLKANSKSTVRENFSDSDLAFKITEVMDYMESEKTNDKNARNHLKNKIKEIYRDCR
ncbi:MAG: BatD family protein [Oscillospiraceae bacterium]|nr:BatD family protein [Oscillospiraceae bacterium]